MVGAVMDVVKMVLARKGIDALKVRGGFWYQEKSNIFSPWEKERHFQ